MKSHSISKREVDGLNKNWGAGHTPIGVSRQNGAGRLSRWEVRQAPADFAMIRVEVQIGSEKHVARILTNENASVFFLASTMIQSIDDERCALLDSNRIIGDKEFGSWLGAIEKLRPSTVVQALKVLEDRQRSVLDTLGIVVEAEPHAYSNMGCSPEYIADLDAQSGNEDFAADE
ncbi:MAG: hypothetical protein LBI61_04210 [Puniceicoccales bacterium]|jgi:hypothetical protein|nr:hypothetical protein [Puniceicoccales bacterium]